MTPPPTKGNNDRKPPARHGERPVARTDKRDAAPAFSIPASVRAPSRPTPPPLAVGWTASYEILSGPATTTAASAAAVRDKMSATKSKPTAAARDHRVVC